MMADQAREQPDAALATEEACPLCRGTGFVRLRVPREDPRFGKALPCRCRQRLLSVQRLERLRRASNLQHLQHMTFDTFQTEGLGASIVSLSLSDALATAREFAAQPSGWLIFTGTYGCGKTHLAAAIANDRVQRGQEVLFVVVPDLLDYLRATYAPNSPASYDERFEQVRTVELLVLDDLGTQNTTPWAAEKLYQLLNYRYNAALATVITSNQPLEEADPRLASRFRDASLVRRVPIYAPDFRARTMGDGLDRRGETFGSLNLYEGLTFSSFHDRRGEVEPAHSAHLRRVRKTVEAYAETPINWLLLRGGYATGKTHLAAAAANRVVRSGMRVLFVVVPDLLDHLRATFQPGTAVSYDQRFNEVRRAPLLVLDDMGTHSATPWAQEKLFQILNLRYVAGLPTIITISTHDWERLEPRLQSRLLDGTRCTILDLDLPPYRGRPAERPAPRRTTRRRL